MRGSGLGRAPNSRPLLDGLITDAELNSKIVVSALLVSAFKCNPDTQEAGWAEGFARGPLFQEETPGDQRSISGMDQVIKFQ